MEAIILAGGFGTRLSHIVLDVPKPMAPVAGHPFLQYIMDFLLDSGVTHIVLAVGYKADIIKNHFGDIYKGIKITYSTENIPLGTGGAIKKALGHCNDADVLIVNGDTYFDVDLKGMKKFHDKIKSSLTVAVKSMSEFERYGSLIIENDKIIKFEEKKKTVQGIINGGVYLIKRTVMNLIDKESFSFEKVVLESALFDIYAFESNGYFIDIGVPEDYYNAQEDYKKML